MLGKLTHLLLVFLIVLACMAPHAALAAPEQAQSNSPFYAGNETHQFNQGNKILGPVISGQNNQGGSGSSYGTMPGSGGNYVGPGSGSGSVFTPQGSNGGGEPGQSEPPPEPAAEPSKFPMVPILIGVGALVLIMMSKKGEAKTA